MSSFFWLLLYLAPLLGVTAALFGWLGWSWRHTDLRNRLQQLETRLEEINAARTAGEKEHDDLRAQASRAETELQSLRTELAQATTSATQERRAAAEALARAEALQASLSQTTHDLEATRLERDQNSAALAAVHAELERLRTEPPLPQPAPTAATTTKTKAPAATKSRPRTSSTSKAPSRPTAKRQGSLHDTLAAVQSHLEAQQSTMETLVRERDDWQRRVTKLEAQATADPAGLGLAYRSLSDSEKRLQAAQAELSRLQTQTRVLHGLEEKAATLATVPDDDLTKIKGIKGVISEQLRAHGIRTWRQIADWDDDELRVFSELLAFKNRATREKWKEQARALHEAAHSGQLL